MKIGELMTRNVKTLSADEKVIDHLGIFKENKFHHIPVTGTGDEVVGMVSSTDFRNYTNLVRILDTRAKPVLLRDIMSSPVVALYEHQETAEAARAMVDNVIHAVIVVGESGSMSGILTSTDLLRYMAENGESPAS